MTTLPGRRGTLAAAIGSQETGVGRATPGVGRTTSKERRGRGDNPLSKLLARTSRTKSGMTPATQGGPHGANGLSASLRGAPPVLAHVPPRAVAVLLRSLEYVAVPSWSRIGSGVRATGN